MPIHLPTISRRAFLARTLTAVAGLALPPRLLADGKPTDGDFWALLSDTHIAANRAQFSRGVNMTDHLNVAARDLMAFPQLPAGVFVTGDCAFEDGTMDDYGTFSDLLRPLREDGMPVHLTLGNHDNRERFWDVLTAERTAKRPLADKQASLLPTPRANWFLLDSLDQNRSKPALILVHHNPGLLGKIGGLQDTEALFKILRPRRQVKVCIYGHTHNWHVRQDGSGIHLINLPPVAYVYEEGKPSGWVRAALGDDRMQIELRCVAKHPLNGETKTLQWRA